MVLATLSEGLASLDDRLFDGIGGFRRSNLGSARHGCGPCRIVGLVAGFPLVEPTFRAPRLLTDVLYFVTGQVAGDGLFSALFVGLAQHPLLESVLCALTMAMCSRCHGTKAIHTVSGWHGDADRAAWITMACRSLDDDSD
jgi:hypothetical protein